MQIDQQAEERSVRSSAHAVSTARTGPEIHDPALLMRVSSIAARLLALSPDAVAGFECVLERFELGQKRYGAPDVNGRAWGVDALEELQDFVVYRGLGLLGERRRSGLRVTHFEAPQVAMSFDTSDVELFAPVASIPEASASFIVDNGIVTELP